MGAAYGTSAGEEYGTGRPPVCTVADPLFSSEDEGDEDDEDRDGDGEQVR